MNTCICRYEHPPSALEQPAPIADRFAIRSKDVDSCRAYYRKITSRRIDARGPSHAIPSPSNKDVALRLTDALQIP
jgi:hypothetical protein